MQFTEANTEGYSAEDLNVLNEAYNLLIVNVDPDFEADTHAVSDGLNNAWEPGDTVETLIARFREQNFSLSQS